jgi:hypothetical protein
MFQGGAVLALHANHCGPSRGAGGFRYVTCAFRYTVFPILPDGVGFIAAGVPVYYVTHHKEEDVPRIVCALLSFSFSPNKLSTITSGRVAWILSWVERIRGRIRGRAGAGWQAIATDVDEPVEMAERRPL